eukprot:1160696-Amphidinium_carterae.1
MKCSNKRVFGLPHGLPRDFTGLERQLSIPLIAAYYPVFMDIVRSTKEFLAIQRHRKKLRTPSYAGKDSPSYSARHWIRV